MKQVCIAVGLIVVGILCGVLGINAGFGGATGIGVIDRIVGNGYVLFTASFFMIGLGVVWLLVYIIYRIWRKYF